MIQGRYLSVPSTVDSGEERRRRRREREGPPPVSLNTNKVFYSCPMILEGDHKFSLSL
jgi:hypothetical protein